MSDVFVSYKAEDRGRIAPLVQALEADGLSVWWDTQIAAGSEWRTPPLWSIGLTAGVSGGEAYLHDGRARTLEEAILWHGGEADEAREAFRTMSAADRAALIKFLQSL